MEDEKKPRPAGRSEVEPALPHEPNDPMHASESEETQGLTMVGVKTVELAQKQLEMTERIWSYMSLYSGGLFVLSLGLLLANDEWLDRASWWYWIFPAVGYLAMAVGNHVSLSNSLKVMRLLRGIAISHTGLELRGSKAGAAERFHLLLVAFVLAFYVIAVLKAY